MKKLTEAQALSLFLEALDEWGCEDNDERARIILDFPAEDLSAYEDRVRLAVIDGGRAALEQEP